MSVNEELAVRKSKYFNEECDIQNPVGRHIIDADCRFESGVYTLFSLPGKLPVLFTVRFTAPVDFTPADAFQIKGEIYAATNQNMEPSAEVLFKAGAVVQCDVDTERKLVFFTKPAGGVREVVVNGFLTEDLDVWVSPTGNDLSGDGTQANPWRNIQYAIDFLAGFHFGRYKATINIEEGEYNESVVISGDAIRGFLCLNVVGAVTLNSVDAEYAITCQVHSRVQITGDILNIVTDQRGAMISRNGALAHISVEEMNITYKALSGSVTPILQCGTSATFGIAPKLLRVTSATTANVSSVFHSNFKGYMSLNFPRVAHAGTIKVRDGYAVSGVTSILQVTQTSTFTGTTPTGPRYHANLNSVLIVNGRGANYFPGNAAGVVYTGAIYA